jgi:uncharacterized protein YbcI
MQNAPTAVVVPDAEQNPLASLSRAMVGLYKLHVGRGPDRARTHWAGPDTVVCELWNTLTPLEHGLAHMGEHHRLRGLRSLVQHAADDEYRLAAGQILGRTVRAHVNGLDIAQDMSVDVFVLEPRIPD